MSTTGPESHGSNDLTVASAGGQGTDGRGFSALPGGKGVWLLALGLATAVGVAAWGVGEYYLDYFKPSEEAASQAYAFTQLNIEKKTADTRNAALTFGALGGLAGLALGVGGGLARRSIGTAVGAGLLGVTLGAALPVGASFAIMPWHYDHKEDDEWRNDLKVPLVVHTTLWAPIGLAGGLALGTGLGGFRGRHMLLGAVGGLVGALIATVIYEVLGAVIFASAETVLPISKTATTRLVSRLFVAVGTALGALLALNSRESVPRRAASLPEA